MKEQEPFDLIQYLLATPIEEILEGTEIAFVGATEKDRQIHSVRFVRIRGIIQRFGQGLTPDESRILLNLMRECVLQKTPDKK